MNLPDAGAAPDWRFVRSLRHDFNRTRRREMFRGSLSHHGSDRSVHLPSTSKDRSTSPRSKKHQQKMVGSAKNIPDRDATEIGFPDRRFLTSDDMFVLLVDDLEADRSDHRQEIFDRYRRALDTILVPSQACRASVHFLVNMLEAYFFAHSDAVNSVLGTNLDDYEGDVETIRNPKAEIKSIYDEYKAVDDGCRIIRRLAVRHVLSRRDACSSLRTMFAGVHKAIGEPESEIGQFLTGRRSDVTKAQICALPW